MLILCLIGINAIGGGMVGCRPQCSFEAEISPSESIPEPVVADPIDRDAPYVSTPEPLHLGVEFSQKIGSVFQAIFSNLVPNLIEVGFSARTLQHCFIGLSP